MPLLDNFDPYLKTWKGIVAVISMVALSFFAIFYKINSKIGEKQNELIDLEKSDVPKPSDFDELCSMPDKSQPCPELGESKVRRSRNSDRINR